MPILFLCGSLNMCIYNYIYIHIYIYIHMYTYIYIYVIYQGPVLTHQQLANSQKPDSNLKNMRKLDLEKHKERIGFVFHYYPMIIPLLSHCIPMSILCLLMKNPLRNPFFKQQKIFCLRMFFLSAGYPTKNISIKLSHIYSHCFFRVAPKKIHQPRSFHEDDLWPSCPIPWSLGR